MQVPSASYIPQQDQSILQNLNQQVLQAQQDPNMEWVAVPSYVPTQLERQAQAQRLQQEYLDQMQRGLEDKVDEVSRKLKRLEDQSTKVKEGPANLLQEPNVQYFDAKGLDDYKKKVETIYYKGLTEVQAQEQVELQKLDAIQKQVHIEQEKLAVGLIREKQAAERNRLLELRQQKRAIQMQMNTREGPVF